MKYITEDDISFGIDKRQKDVYTLVAACCVPLVTLFCFVAFKPPFVTDEEGRFKKKQVFLWVSLITVVIWVLTYTMYLM